MNKNYYKLLGALFLVFTFFSIASAQSGIIEGYVRDDNGVGIGGVTLKLYKTSDNSLVGTFTTVNTVQDQSMYGRYEFTGLSAGEYYVVEEQPPGFEDVSEVDGGDDMDHPDNGITNNIPVTLSTDDERDTGNNFVERVPIEFQDCPAGTTEATFDWSTSAGSGNEWTKDDNMDGATRTYTLSYTDALGIAQTVDVTMTMRDPDGINLDTDFTCPTDVCDDTYDFYTSTNGNFGGGFLTLAEATTSINQELTFDFEFSKPVVLKDFSVSDIDWVSYNTLNSSHPSVDDTYINFQDEVTIVAENDGNSIGLDYNVGSNLTLYDGNTVRSTDYYVNADGTGVVGDVSPSYPTNAVYVSSNTEIDKLSVTFRNGDGDTLDKNGMTDPGHSDGHFVRLNGFKFCIIDYAQVGGRVTEDTDNDDAGDVGISGVTITLQNPDGTTATDANGTPLVTTTSDGTTDVDGDGTIDPAGSYYFMNVDVGIYNIVQTQPDGYLTVTDEDSSDDGDTNSNSSTTDNSIPVTLTPGEQDVNNDFVEEKPAKIKGQVLVDEDNNDTGDSGLSGVTITLKNPDGTTATDADGTPLTTTTSDGTTDVDGDGMVDPAGSYYFGNIPPGEYTIEQTQPDNYTTVSDGDTSDDGDTTSNTSTTDNQIPVTLTSGEFDQNNDFIEEPSGTVSGQVLADNDNDDTGDEGIAGVTITLQNADGTTAVDAKGNALTTTTSDGTTDVDGDGTIDPAGSYYFGNVPPGEYNVVETQPDGYNTITDEDTSDDSDTNTNDSTTDNSIPVTVTPGENDANNNFVEEKTATISGNVSLDDDGDNANNQNLSGVVIQLLNTDGTPVKDDMDNDITATTDADGNYIFENVPPGDYLIKEVQPDSYVSQSDGDSTDASDDATNSSITDNTIPVSVEAGETDDGNNFVEKPGNTISGTVYIDNEDNGRVDQSAPFAGVTISLQDADGNIILDENGNPYTTTTDADGNYTFNGVPDGTYFIVQTQPLGYNSFSDTDTVVDAGDSNDNGSNTTIDNSIEVTVMGGQTDSGNNFVESQLPTPVSLVKFDLSHENSDVVLQWVTAREDNNAYFDVEVSTDGYRFHAVERLESKAINGTSSTSLNYEFVHRNALKQIQEVESIYYRLKQVDSNGEFAYSGMKSVSTKNFGKTAEIRFDGVNVLQVSKGGLRTVEIYDMQGKLVYEIDAEGKSEITIRTDSLKAALYIIVVNGGESHKVLIH